MKVILQRRGQNDHICRCYHTPLLLRNARESTIRTLKRIQLGGYKINVQDLEHSVCQQ